MRISLLTFVFFVLHGCIFTYLDNGITGNGNVVEKQRQVKSFHGIHVGNGIDVNITQGDKEDLLLIADENLHDVIITEVENDILKINSKENIKKATTLKIELNYKYLDLIKISSAGDVKSRNKLVTEDMDIRLSSAGDLELEIEAENINCNITSSGDAFLKGSTITLDANLSSAGDLNAFELIAEECKVRVSSAGNAKVYATKLFDLEASSAGDIYYKGNGKIENLKTSSAGTIKNHN